MANYFLGIHLETSVQQTIAQLLEDVKQQREAKISWLPERNYHITLGFIGEVDEQDIAKISAVLQPAVEQQPAPEFRFQTAKFYHTRPNAAGVITLESPEEGLTHIHRQAKEALIQADIGYDFAGNHGYSPHITVARSKKKVSEIEEAIFTTIDQQLDRGQAFVAAKAQLLHFDHPSQCYVRDAEYHLK